MAQRSFFNKEITRVSITGYNSFFGRVWKTSYWRLFGISRSNAFESSNRHFFTAFSDNSFRVNIGSTIYTLVLSILRGNSLSRMPRYFSNQGTGKKTSCWSTKHLFRFVLAIINSSNDYSEEKARQYVNAKNIWKPANARNIGKLANTRNIWKGGMRKLIHQNARKSFFCQVFLLTISFCLIFFTIQICARKVSCDISRKIKIK